MNVDINLISESELKKVVKTDKSQFNIELDRTNGLWSISTSSGPVPVALRGKYTSPGAASVAIKNYVDGAPNRSIVYKNPKKED